MKPAVHDISAAIARLVKDEMGQSLVLALVVLLALTVGTAGVITYMTSNESSFSRDRDVNRAMGVAEAGLQNGISVLTSYDANLLEPAGATVGPTSFTFDGGTGSYKALKSIPDPTSKINYWTITSTGTSPDGRVTRTVQQQIQAAVNNNSVLDYSLYVAGSATIGGSFQANGNIFVGGDLTMSGGAVITPSAPNTDTVQINGTLYGKNNTAIGTATDEFQSVSAKQCYVQNSQQICSTSASSNVWAQTIGANPQPNIKPEMNTTSASAIYTAAQWSAPSAGTAGPCSPTTAPIFEQSGDNLASPTRNVTLNTGTYDCIFTDAGGSFVGEIAYSSATNILTINGKVFIAGNLALNTNPGFEYQGIGEIYVDGTVSAKQSICGAPSTPTSTGCTGGTWDQKDNDMEIIAMNVVNCPPPTSSTPTPCTNSNAGWTVNAQANFDVVAFVVGGVSATGNGSQTDFQGPVIADVAGISGGGGLQYPTDVSQQFFGQSFFWELAPNSWRQCGPGGLSSAQCSSS